MKRLLSGICLAAALLLMPARSEAAAIYVGFLDFYEDDPLFGAYIDVFNSSNSDLSPLLEYQPGSMSDLMLTIETTGGPAQFVYGKETASGGSCMTDSSADFFSASHECLTLESLAVGESTRFLFNAAGISILDFVSATLTFQFAGTAGDPATVTLDEFVMDLTATRQETVPEPASLLLLGTGAAAVALRRRRR